MLYKYRDRFQTIKSETRKEKPDAVAIFSRRKPKPRDNRLSLKTKLSTTACLEKIKTFYNDTSSFTASFFLYTIANVRVIRYFIREHAYKANGIGDDELLKILRTIIFLVSEYYVCVPSERGSAISPINYHARRSTSSFIK